MASSILQITDNILQKFNRYQIPDMFLRFRLFNATCSISVICCLLRATYSLSLQPVKLKVEF